MKGLIVTIAVAVTGGIGAGKSTIAGLLAGHGALVVDSDQLARQVVAHGTPGLAAIVDAFGPEILTADGTLDRAALARVVFADPQARQRLERITHPLVRAGFVQAFRTAPSDAVVVNDIPLLVSLEGAAQFHLVIGVYAPEDLRVARLVSRGLTEPDARARMAAQISDYERAQLCDIWLPNDGDQEAARALIAQVWSERLIPLRDNVIAGKRASRPGPKLVEPQPHWTADAARLAARIALATGGARVDHIGSTAIAGLPAKDVIDLQLTADSFEQADDWCDALSEAGFPRVDELLADTPHPEGADPRLWQKRFHANADPGRTVNLHIRLRDSPGWRWALLFRDWLNADPLVRADYLQLKRLAAAQHAGEASVDGYADAKEPWMAKVYPRGLEWVQRTGWRP